jgi:hypothetical protein
VKERWTGFGKRTLLVPAEFAITEVIQFERPAQEMRSATASLLVALAMTLAECEANIAKLEGSISFMWNLLTNTDDRRFAAQTREVLEQYCSALALKEVERQWLLAARPVKKQPPG